MAYQFATKKDVQAANKWCRSVLIDVQNLVRDWFTFDFRLIGSGGKHLVTYNEGQPFDLDYNIIIQKDKHSLHDKPAIIKEKFIEAFKAVFSKTITGFNADEYFKINNSTSVITIKYISYGSLEFSFDVAIMQENENGYLEKIIFDKKNNVFIWNKVKQSDNLYDKAVQVKQNYDWNKVRNRYLELKNNSLRNNDETKSFSIFIQVINEFYQQL